MLVEAEKLTWFGIDLRQRWRRRVVVALTYALFLFVIWSPSSRVTGCLEAAFWISIFWSNVEDTGTAVRWFVRGFSMLFAGFWMYSAWHHPLRDITSQGGMYALALLAVRSIVGYGHKLIEYGRPNWLAEAMRNLHDLSWRQQRRLARHGFAIGLDGFAWYEYSARFQSLNQLQKEEIEGLAQANPRGKWMRARAGVLFDDERLRNEEARLRERVQKILSWVLVLTAFCMSIVWADGGVVSTARVGSLLWTLAGLATTLRQAIPLWTENAPGEGLGEIALVEASRA